MAAIPDRLDAFTVTGFRNRADLDGLLRAALTSRLATCSVSDDAWLIPDFNCPVHGERLMREFGQVEGDPSVYWQERTDIDLRPSGKPAIAMCISILTALEAIEASR